jgi:hypothetical protein
LAPGYREVQSLDGFVDVALLLVVVGVTKALAPVAEVGRDDEQVGRVGQEFGENSAVLALLQAVSVFILKYQIYKCITILLLTPFVYSFSMKFCPKF